MPKRESQLLKERILIVEDNDRLRALISIILKVKGYEVRGVSDGRQALEAVAEEKPHLILLDVMLPGLNGFEVCQHIKNDPATRKIPVVMLTAKQSTVDRTRGEQVGADFYMTKPFKTAQVVDTIQRVLESRHSKESKLPSQKLQLTSEAL